MKEVNVAFMVSHLLNLCSSSVVPPKVGIHHEQLLQSVGQEKLQASAFALFHLVYAALIMVTFHWAMLLKKASYSLFFLSPAIKPNALLTKKEEEM